MELTAGGCLPTFTSASSSTITQPSLRLNCVTRLKGVAESPPSPPHPEPSYAQLNWKEAKFWTGSSLQLSLSLSLPQSVPVSLCLSLSPPPPPQCPTQQPLFPVLSSYMAAEPWVAAEENRVLRSCEEEEEETRA